MNIGVLCALWELTLGSEGAHPRQDSGARGGSGGTGMDALGQSGAVRHSGRVPSPGRKEVCQEELGCGLATQRLWGGW